MSELKEKGEAFFEALTQNGTVQDFYAWVMKNMPHDRLGNSVNGFAGAVFGILGRCLA